jgi:FtsZ-binding cell division protein ZapB
VSDIGPPAPRRTNVFPMLRRMGEAVKTIFDLVDAVEQLKRKNDSLTAKVDELRREVDQQAGQIRVLLGFVRGALDDRIQRRAEAAARSVVAELEAKLGRRPTKKK